MIEHRDQGTGDGSRGTTQGCEGRWPWISSLHTVIKQNKTKKRAWTHQVNRRTSRAGRKAYLRGVLGASDGPAPLNRTEAKAASFCRSLGLGFPLLKAEVSWSEYRSLSMLNQPLCCGLVWYDFQPTCTWRQQSCVCAYSCFDRQVQSWSGCRHACPQLRQRNVWGASGSGRGPWDCTHSRGLRGLSQSVLSGQGTSMLI